MRIKVQTQPPINHLKAWFSIPISLLNDESTINDLKEHMCARLPVLSGNGGDIVLILDGFELLDDSAVNVLREGDLVCIKLDSSLKRKVVVDAPKSTTKKTKQASVPPAKSLKRKRESGSSSSSSSSSDSSSSESDEKDSDSSDSSSSSSSSSSESSTSSSDSDSDSPPLRLPPKPKTKRLNFTNSEPKNTAAPPHPTSVPVPPGYGKPTTHSRNLRRRLKKAYVREESNSLPPPPPKVISKSNGVALGSSSKSVELAPSAPTNGDADQDLTMLSLLTKNKNKKKNFKGSFASALPQKIVFGEDVSEEAIAALNDNTSISTPEPQAAPTQPETPFLPRLIPPSEHQELGTLPPRIFVTSVDVEEGISKKNKKDKGKGKGKELSSMAMSTSISGKVDPRGKPEFDNLPRGVIAEDFGESDPVDTYMKHSDLAAQCPMPGYSMTGTSTADQTPSYEEVERKWDAYKLIEKWEDMKEGFVVGWKDIGLNSNTLTPEYLLTLAHIKDLEHTGEVVVEPIPRPGAKAAAFGGVDLGTIDGMEEIYLWADDIATGGWRIVRS